MVQPTPFDRLLQDAAQQANRDPLATYGRLDELYGKTMTEADVISLGAFAVHLGAAGLGRFGDAAAFQKKLLTHPQVAQGSAAARSLWRGLAVILLCANQQADAEAALAQGIANDSERARFLVMSAQTFAARARHADAARQLDAAARLLPTLAEKDEIVAQGAAIALNLARLAESQLRSARDLLLAASSAAMAALGRHPDWRARHQGLYHQGKSFLLAADPTRALAAVQAMMELEDAHDAGPTERFHTAALACRAQVVRGQFKIADGALEACRDFAKRVMGDGAKPVQAALEELERFVAQGRQTGR